MSNAKYFEFVKETPKSNEEPSLPQSLAGKREVARRFLSSDGPIWSSICSSMSGILIVFFSGPVAHTAIKEVKGESKTSLVEMVRPESTVSFYGQNVFDSRTGNFVTQNRLRSGLVDFLLGPKASSHHPFLGARAQLFGGAYLEEDTHSREGLVYNDNFMAPTLGATVMLPAMGFGASSEIQYQWRKSKAKQVDRLATLQARTSLWHSFQAGLKKHNQVDLGEGRALDLLIETYAETVHRTELGSNVFAAFVGRVGPRLIFSERWTADVFPELSLRRDLGGLAWENLSELRFGARTTYQKFTTDSRFGQRNGTSLSLQTTTSTGLYDGDRRYLSPFKAALILGLEI